MDYSQYFPQAASKGTDYSGFFPPESAATAPKQKPLVTLGAEGMKESLRQEASSRGRGEQFMAGVGTTVNDAAMRLKQILGGNLNPQETADVQAGRQLRQVSTPAMLGGMGGQVAMTYPIAPATLLGNVAAGGAIGAAMEPVLPGETTLGNVGRGAIGGGAGYGVARGLGAVAQPIVQSPQVQRLLGEGIVPTPGQAMRSNGGALGNAMGRMEDAATSIPLLGDLVTGGRRRGFQEVQEAAIRRATPQGVQPAQGIGREAIEQTDNAVSDAYNVALGRIGTVALDNRFLNSAPQIVQRAVTLNPAQRADVTNVVDQIISSRVNPAGGRIPADVAKTIDSDLGAVARDYATSAQASERRVGNVIRDIQSQWRDLIRRNAPDQQTAEMLDDANRAFANLLRVEKAATKGATTAGEFTPGQLSMAVRELTPNKRQFARGNALMQDLSDPAAQTLTGRLGESGTVPRGMLGMGLLGLGGAYGNEKMGGPDLLTNMAIGAALLGPLYSRAGSRYALGDLLPLNIQPMLREGAEAAAPYAGRLGAGYMLNQR